MDSEICVDFNTKINHSDLNNSVQKSIKTHDIITTKAHKGGQTVVLNTQ